jgi:preprotein translocase subunit SecA
MPKINRNDTIQNVDNGQTQEMKFKSGESNSGKWVIVKG